MVINLETATKKELKIYASSIKKSNPNFPKYINLTISDEQQLKEYIQEFWEWEKGAEARAVEELAQQEQEKLERQQQEENRLIAVKTAIAQLTQLQSQPIKLSELGNKIAQFIELEPNMQSTPWSKNGEMRIYIRDESMTRSDRGFVLVTEKINLHNLNARLEQEEFLRKLEFTQVENDLTPTPRRRSPDEIQAAIKAGDRVGQDEIESALNSMYGEGNWDDRDRLDFEG